LAVFLLALAYLLLHYLTLPDVREKRRLQKQVKLLEKEFAVARDSLAEAQEENANIRRLAQQDVDNWHSTHQTRVSGLKNQREALLASQEDELQLELNRLQKEHLEAGLKSVPLEIASIPGIGPALAEKLLESNIQTAFDITREPIQAIPGFGEAKAQSLLWWRGTLERELMASQPVDLPVELKTAILQQYNNELMQVDLDMQAAHHDLEKNLAEIHEREAQQLATGMAHETAARQRLADLEGEKQQAQDALKGLEPATFLKFVSAAVRSGRSGFRAQLLTVLLPFALLAGGLLLAVIALGLLLWMQFGGTG
jgi:DNA-binding helix-hairpin-helix protein with protein kinase domain